MTELYLERSDSEYWAAGLPPIPQLKTLNCTDNLITRWMHFFPVFEKNYKPIPNAILTTARACWRNFQNF